MRPQVDKHRTNTPARGVSTTGNNTAGYSARHLIEELDMRTKAHALSRSRSLALASLALFTAACVGEVGGGTASRGRGSNAAKDPHSDHGDCDDPERVSSPITIRSAADFDKLPKGCWDLWAKLRLEGPAITSLAGLGDLIAVDSIELVDTGLISFDSPKQVEVYGSVLVSGNNRLVDIDHLVAEEWGTVTASTITLRDNPELAGLGGLRYLAQVTGALSITSNPKLKRVELAELARAGSVVVSNNSIATEVELGSLEQVGRIEIANNALLASIIGPAAGSLGGDLIVRGNRSLTTLGSWSSLSTIQGALAIDDNDGLRELGALSSLQYVAGGVSLTENVLLDNISPISHLRGIGGTATITGNPSLSKCSAIEVAHCVSNMGNRVTINANKPNTGSSCRCWCE